MRETGKLNAKRVANLKRSGRYADGHGLYLQVLAPTMVLAATL